MKDLLLLSVKQFLEQRQLTGAPLLLAYSGGPDSKALLYLLRACQRFFPLQLHLAHVDHSWRPESHTEAQALEQEAAQLNVPFHLKRLDPPAGPNVEARSREARLTFFRTVYEAIGAQALLMGHHADDHAETVLKRIFEGAHLRHAGGMAPVGELLGMHLWRPLLSFSKKELGLWLEKQGLQGILDATNADTRYLRGRMRQELLPLLAEKFGKEISGNLCRIGRVADELSAYFAVKLKSCFSTLRATPEGIHWDLSSYNLEKIEWEYLIRQWLQEQSLALSHQMFHDLIASLQKKKGRRCFHLKKQDLLISGGDLFLLNKQN